MFEKLSKMLERLEDARGTKNKEDLLEVFLLDSDFVWLAKSALDDGISYGIDDIPEFCPQSPTQHNHTDEEIKEHLERLAKSTGVTDVKLAETYRLACISADHYKVMVRILRKDLKCGVGAKTINKVRADTINKTKYQRCSQYDRIDKMTWPCLFQRKANGAFAYGLPDGSFMTRQGNIFEIPGNLISPFVAGLPNLSDKVRIHELVVLDETGTKVMSRAEGNGIINSFIKGTGDPEMASASGPSSWAG